MSAKGAKLTRKPTKPRYFATPADFRAWLTANHATAPELLVGFHKIGSGKPSITWPESVDEALCFGWIDGVRRSLGDDALHDPLHAAPAAQHLERDQHPSASPCSKPKARSPPPAAPRSPRATPSARASTASSKRRRPRSPPRNARRSRQREGVGILHCATALVPAHRDALGGQRQETGDARHGACAR